MLENENKLVLGRTWLASAKNWSKWPGLNDEDKI
jgi:hypothetical protein